MPHLQYDVPVGTCWYWPRFWVSCIHIRDQMTQKNIKKLKFNSYSLCWGIVATHGIHSTNRFRSWAFGRYLDTHLIFWSVARISIDTWLQKELIGHKKVINKGENLHNSSAVTKPQLHSQKTSKLCPLEKRKRSKTQWKSEKVSSSARKKPKWKIISSIRHSIRSEIKSN